MISARQRLVGKISAKQSLKGKLNNSIIKEYPELESLEVTPTGKKQVFKSDKYGYGTVTVNAVEGIDTSDATATAEDILEGRTAYVNGKKIVGTMIAHTVLEYIQSTGEQWIDLGFKYDNTTKIELDFEDTSSDAWSVYLGDNSGAIQLQKQNHDSVYVHCLGSGHTPYFDFSKRHVITYDKNLFYIDGELIHTFTEQSYLGRNTTAIFAVYGGEVPSRMKFYSCKVYKNDSIIMNLIPVLNNEGEAVLYDTINKVYYKNKTTTPFVYE